MAIDTLPVPVPWCVGVAVGGSSQGFSSSPGLRRMPRAWSHQSFGRRAVLAGWRSATAERRAGACLPVPMPPSGLSAVYPIFNPHSYPSNRKVCV